jgi:hypothetical protein
LSFRGRLRFGRPPILASALAALLVVVGSGTVVAGTPEATVAPPQPRVQRPGDTAGYRLPFEAGLEVYIHQAWNNSYSHFGRARYAYDFGLQMYTPVLASATGVVSFVRDGQYGCGGKKFKNRANYVTIDHPDGSSTLYGHLATIKVKVGQVVEAGEVIARSGKSGYTDCQPHLHFERTLQGGLRGLGQSIPIYFQEYPDGRLLDGQTVHAAPLCGATRAGMGTAVAPPLGQFCATYRGVDAGSPVLVQRLEDGIDHHWAHQAPGGYWLDDAARGFFATWTGQFRIDEAGVYGLKVEASDRVRVRVDGVTLVDASAEAAHSRDLSVAWRATAGKHTIEVEHLDRNGHGSLRVSWSPLLIDGAWVRWAKSKPEA